MSNVEVLVPVGSLEEAAEVRGLASENPALTVYCTVRAERGFRCVRDGDLFVAMGRNSDQESCRKCFGGPDRIYEPESCVPLEHFLSGEGCPWHGRERMRASYEDIFVDLDCEPGVWPAGEGQALPLMLEELEQTRTKETEYPVPFEVLESDPIFSERLIHWRGSPRRPYWGDPAPQWVYRSPVGAIGIQRSADTLERLVWLERGWPSDWAIEGRTRLEGHDRAELLLPRVCSPDQLQDSVVKETVTWLDAYFSGEQAPLPPFKTKGSALQELVWDELRRIPYGTVVDSETFAARVAVRRGSRTTVRSLSRALNDNPLAPIIPCHRLVTEGGDALGDWTTQERRSRLVAGEAKGFSWSLPGDLSALLVPKPQQASRDTVPITSIYEPPCCGDFPF